MTGQDKAATPVLGVGDMARQFFCACVPDYSERGLRAPECEQHARLELLDELGIDPDMSVESLRSRLLWGERVERSLVLTDDPLFVVTDEGQMTQSATWFRGSLTRPDTTDSPAS